MKKALVIMILFTILAVTFTATMINIKKQDSMPVNTSNNINNNEVHNQNNTSNEEVLNGNKTNEISEKTLDLFSTFDENDLVFEKYEVDYPDDMINKIELYKISGLKNKEVENKINTDMKDRILKFIDEKCKRKNIKEISIYNYGVLANFANVFSTCIVCSYTIYDEFEWDYSDCLGLNYELVNGNRLEVEDLFTKNEGVEDIIRLSLYKKNVESERDFRTYGEYGMGEGPEDIFFNPETQSWQYLGYVHDYEKGEWKEEYKDYTPNFSDYEIEKKVRNGISQDDFWFTPAKVNINFGESFRQIKIDEDGINREYIGSQNFQASYLFKDIANRVTIYNKYLTNESIFEKNNIGNRDIIVCSEEQDHYAKHSIFKSDNYFYDFVQFYNEEESNFYYKDHYSETLINKMNSKIQEIIDYYDKESSNNKDKAYFMFVYPFNGYGYKKNTEREIFFTSRIITCDISDKDSFMSQLFENVYRYPNLGMHGRWPYNVISLEYDEWAYVQPIKCDSAKDEKTYYYYNIDAEELITESNVLKLYKEDLENRNIDYLNETYNEIFARHGHDFKSEELKKYFSQFSWYKPIPGKTVSIDELSEMERYNANLIKEEIDQKKGN